MSIAVIITFDLHNVSKSDKFRTYTNIKKSLGDLKFKKFLLTRGRRVKLPANTFVGFLKGIPEKDLKSSAVRDRVRKRASDTIEKHHSNFRFSYSWEKSGLGGNVRLRNDSLKSKAVSTDHSLLHFDELHL